MLRHLGLTLPVNVILEEGTGPTPAQQRMLASLEELPTSVLTEIDLHALRYFNNIDEAETAEEVGIQIDPKRIRQHYRLTAATIPILRDSPRQFFFLYADCDWDPEHGLEILLNGTEVLYCDAPTTLCDSPRWLEMLSTTENLTNKARELNGLED